MYIECPECQARRYTIELPRSGTKYRCQQCGMNYVIPQAVYVPEIKMATDSMVLGHGKPMRLAVSVAALAILLIFAVGSPFVSAHLEQGAPGRLDSIATTNSEPLAEPLGLIENVRTVVASCERSIVSTAVQSMRVAEHLKVVPVVTVPTNNMACFPSKEYPLFPKYVERKSSQFRYTIDGNGIVSVHLAGATTDALVEKITELLQQHIEVEQISDSYLQSLTTAG